MAEKITTYVRFADDIREQLEIAAASEQRSLSNMIAVLVAEALKAREAREGFNESEFWEDQARYGFGTDY
jgi:hypothetical protein